MGVKLLVLLGGWCGWVMLSEDFAQISSSDALRKVFVTELATFVRTHDFDGVVINWQYPGCRGVYCQYPHTWKQQTLSLLQTSCTSAYLSEKANFVKLMQALKAELDKEKLIVASLPAFADFLVGRPFH
jgi:GH18 family chitinase